MNQQSELSRKIIVVIAIFFVIYIILFFVLDAQVFDRSTSIGNKLLITLVGEIVLVVLGGFSWKVAHDREKMKYEVIGRAIKKAEISKQQQGSVKKRVRARNSGLLPSHKSTNHREPDDYQRIRKRSSNTRRFLRKIASVETSSRWDFTKPGDTCWSCGETLSVDKLSCQACGERRIICFVCRKNIDRNDRIGACPACRNNFHFTHIREAVKVSGRCPMCKQRMNMEEIVELGITDDE